MVDLVGERMDARYLHRYRGTLAGRKMTSPVDLKSALDQAEEELAAVYRKVWPLREAYAETFPPAALPAPRNRTDKQALVARCPRCGGKLDAEQS
jgi:hypothetical protein